MKARTGQIALFLVMILAVICVLAVMNVGSFLCIRAKNRAMNAGDAAALAVAKYQGELLNEIGTLNVAHLQAALANDEAKCAEIMERQLRTCFLAPVKGISVGSEAARKNHAASWKHDSDDKWKEFFRAHVADIRSVYANDPQSYPEPWSGAWLEFASELELQISPRLYAWPENAEFADLRESFPLAAQAFYSAIAGRAWCWFHFHGMWLLSRSSDQMPLPDFTEPEVHFNSEIYPLHLKFEPLPEVLDATWTEIVKRVAGCSEAEIAASYLITNGTQKWAFYDSRWNRWSTYDGIAYNPDEFPSIGNVKPQYDVLGCAAICRIMYGARDLFASDERSVGVDWTAAAKPFGTVANADGDMDVVTALNRFVVPAFETMRLVPVDSVGGRDLHTADVEWMIHLKHHIRSSPYYTAPNPSGCWYCAQLKLWDDPFFRRQGEEWLRLNSSTCTRPTGSGSHHGGTSHGH